MCDSSSNCAHVRTRFKMAPGWAKGGTIKKSAGLPPQAHKVVHSGYRWIAGFGLFAIAIGYGALLFVWRNHRSE